MIKQALSGFGQDITEHQFSELSGISHGFTPDMITEVVDEVVDVAIFELRDCRILKTERRDGADYYFPSKSSSSQTMSKEQISVWNRVRPRNISYGEVARAFDGVGMLSSISRADAEHDAWSREMVFRSH